MANTAVDYGPSGKKKTTYNTANLLKVSNSPALQLAQRSTAPASGASSFGGAFGNAANVVANTARDVANSVGLKTTTPTNTGSGFGGLMNNAANTVANTIRNVVASAGYTPSGNTSPTNTTPENTSGGDGGTPPTYNGGGGSSSGGSSSGGSTGGGSASSTSRQSVRTDMDAAVPNNTVDNTGAQLFDLYQRYLDDLRNQANTAYNLNMERIRQAYDSNSRIIADALANSKSQLQNTYDKSARDVRDDSEQALRESYINYMLSRKNLGQELSALGLNGGEAETTLGSLLNNYGNSRNAIETTRNKNLSNLGEALQSGVAQAQQGYNSALQSLINNRLNAENAAENARQNLLANFATNLNDLAISNEPYINAVRSLAETVSGVPVAPVQATNTYEGTNMRQGGVPFTPASGNPYARFIAQANMMRQGGSSDEDIKNYLFGAVGNDSNALTQIFADLGLA